MVTFKFLTQFPADHLSYPVVSSLILFLCWFAEYAYYDWSLHLSHHVIYICCFVASYPFLIWYVRFLWHCFFLLLEEIKFLSHGFFLLSYIHVFSRDGERIVSLFWVNLCHSYVFPWRCPWCNGTIYQPLRSGRIWHKVNFFKRSLTGFEFRVSD